MGGAPKPPPPIPKPPQVDEAAQAIDSSNRLLRRKGFASTILSKGDVSTPSVGVSKLLGN